MKLRHIALPGITHYTTASRLQSALVSQHLAHKSSPSTINAPPPTILTAQFHPVYTSGRRDWNRLTASEIAHLRADGRAEYHAAQRGGQTTFHGPGQVVAYPVLDLRCHGLSSRSYVALLEDVVIATCARYGVKAGRTENTGVWVGSEREVWRKIAAVGVRLRRHVASHGVALNVSTELGWFERIVACGLEGMESTSIVKEGLGIDISVEEVANVFVEEITRKLEGVDGIDVIDSGCVKIGEEDGQFNA